MFEFMHQRFLVLFLLLGVLLDFPSHVRGKCISGAVSFLNKTWGDNVLFHVDTKISNETQLIRWYLKSKNQLLLAISPGESRPSWIIQQKEYEGRLSVTDDKSLKLMDVTSDDNGCYEVNIRSASGKIYIQKFLLTVSGFVSTESNMNPWICLVISIGFLIGVLVLAVWVFCPNKQQKCLNNVRGILRRRRNMPPISNHMEEKKLEEGCALVQVASFSGQETDVDTWSLASYNHTGQ